MTKTKEENDYILVEVKFETTAYKTYWYRCSTKSVKKGDYVVVKAPSGWPTVAQVLSTVDKYSARAFKASKYVIQKVSLKRYNEREERFQRKAKLEKSLDEMLKEVQKVTLYETLAGASPEFKELLKEYKEV